VVGGGREEGRGAVPRHREPAAQRGGDGGLRRVPEGGRDEGEGAARAAVGAGQHARVPVAALTGYPGKAVTTKDTKHTKEDKDSRRRRSLLFFFCLRSSFVSFLSFVVANFWIASDGRTSSLRPAPAAPIMDLLLPPPPPAETLTMRRTLAAA